MNTKHTPGPWAIIPKGKPFAGDIADNTGAVVAQAYLNEHQANAKLIAAAPDLLAALERIELRLTQARIASGIGQPRLKDADFLRRECERIATDAREAIANATK